jgi:hypothetical protein
MLTSQQRRITLKQRNCKFTLMLGSRLSYRDLISSFPLLRTAKELLTLEANIGLGSIRLSRVCNGRLRAHLWR